MEDKTKRSGNKMQWFATVPRTMEGLLAAELKELGARDIRETNAGVKFSGDLRTAYRVVLWSRLASRIMLVLSEFSARNRQQLYDEIRSIGWLKHVPPDGTFMVHSTFTSEAFNNSEFTALVAKDAIVDQIRDVTGFRPSIDRQHPDLTVHLHGQDDHVSVAVDLTRHSLHRRGYRSEQGEAPLRENVAAALLIRAGWPGAFPPPAALLDPMCGAGTIVIEAALMSADVAPGILPGAAGLNNWTGHVPAVWSELTAEAQLRRKNGLRNMPRLIGLDTDGSLIEIARKNAARAQMEHSIEFRQEDAIQAKPPEGIAGGLIAVNPPYGKRMSPEKDIVAIYNSLGESWARDFIGWKAVVITSEKAYARSIGLRALKINTIYNGGIECTLAQFQMTTENEYRPYHPGMGLSHGLEPRVKRYDREIAEFENRLTKNQRNLRSWLVKQSITCYRLYDADLPNYSLALDIYENKWAVVQEYAPPASIDPVKANDRLHAALEVIHKVTGTDPRNIFLKRRRRQSGTDRYEKQSEAGRFEEIGEGGLRFLVNLSDYLDTGIFLDHRPLRMRIRSEAKGKRFLNLFSYTGTATVYAIAGGAAFTRSVDASNTYLAWAEANLQRNGFNPDDHSAVRSDCMEWLAVDRDRYDLILCDPPTYSVSKDRPSFDIQKDHPLLIQKAVARLRPHGKLYFSTNFRKFRLDSEALSGLVVKEISRETIPRDFQRNNRIHRVWIITVSGSESGSRNRRAESQDPTQRLPGAERSGT